MPLFQEHWNSQSLFKMRASAHCLKSIKALTRVGIAPCYTSFLFHFTEANGSLTTADSGPGVIMPGTLSFPGVTAGGGIDSSVQFLGQNSWKGQYEARIAIDWPILSPNVGSTGVNPWTFDFRIRSTSFASQQVVIDTNSNGTNTTGWTIYIDTDAKMKLYAGAQGVGYGGFGSAMSTNTSYAMRVVWDGTTLHFYRDGVKLGTNTGFTNVWGNLIWLANSADASQHVRGNLGEIRFTKTAVTTASSYTVATSPFTACQA